MHSTKKKNYTKHAKPLMFNRDAIAHAKIQKLNFHLIFNLSNI